MGAADLYGGRPGCGVSVDPAEHDCPEARAVADQGWAFPGASRKAHYFRGDKRSLCGKWGSFGMPPAAFERETEYPSSSDCVACRRKLDAQGVQ